MTRFHQYITSGSTASQALCLAQRDMIQKKMNQPDNRNLRSVDVSKLTSSMNMKIIDNPFFWAPFILVGNLDISKDGINPRIPGVRIIQECACRKSI